MRWRTAQHSFLLLVGMTTSVCAQGITIPLAQLQSPSAGVRRAAFYAMVDQAAKNGKPTGPGWSGARTDALVAQARHDPALAGVLISLLETEDRVASVPAQLRDQQWDGEGYYPDVATTVSAIHDKRSINALIPVIGMHQYIRNTLARFGDDAVQPVIAAVNSPDVTVSIGAVITLKTMAQQPSGHFSTASLQSIKTTLLHTLSSPEEALREDAVNGLMAFTGADVRMALEQVAANDPTSFVGAGGVRRFPVRDAAKGWLQQHPKI